MRRAVFIALGVVLLTLGSTTLAQAQDDPTTTTTTTTLAELPPAHIIPRPNSGTPPTDAGDRGGALQLGLLALGIVTLTGAVVHVVRESQRARAARDQE